jgi:ferrochelatase
MNPASESPPALLLVNLGTPAAPTAPAVRRYLAEFLHDHRVVQLSRWLWCPLLHFVILPLRSPKVAVKYASVWLPGGSPLAVHTAALADAVRERLPGWRVLHAMRYGEPSIAAALDVLRAQGVRSVRVLPLYPQYSTTTTASVADAIAKHARGLQVAMLHDYHRDPGWAAAVADSIRTHWATHGRGERLLLSFHGIPQRLVDGGDPYALQCEASTVAIAEALGIPRGDILLTFQSRFGKERWLQPYTQQDAGSAGARGRAHDRRRLPRLRGGLPGNAGGNRGGERACVPAAGGETLRYIPCLNAGDAHAEALAALVQGDEGWS